MRETGGVLVGWRTAANEVVVIDMVEVKDPRSGHTSYRRRHASAEQTLAVALGRYGNDSPAGYVGEWHTHPAPVGPSFIDRFEIRRISRKTDERIALVVCAYDAQVGSWHPCGLVAQAGVRPTTAVITIEEGPTDA